MKRYLAIFGFVFIGVIAGLIVRGIPIVLQVNAGGGIQTDRNGDVNGDARLDMSDAVYLLLHIFRDGPQPVALAQGLPDNAEQLLEEIADPCRDRANRYVTHGNGTVTDTCSGLMWLNTSADINGDGIRDGGDQLSWQDAVSQCRGLQFAGHNDWRLPTAEELLTLHHRPSGYRSSPWFTGINPAIEPLHAQHWTATESVKTVNEFWWWRPGAEFQCSRAAAGNRMMVLPVRTAQ